MQGDDPRLDLDVYNAVRAHELELNRATAAFEHAVLSPLYLLNGGALVAFLTLLGAASGEDSSLEIELPWAVAGAALWATGLCAAAFATYWGYRSQRYFTRVERLRRQEVERSLLPAGSELRDIVAKLDEMYTRDGESKKAKITHKRFQWAAAAGLGCFLVGAALAGVSVL